MFSGMGHLQENGSSLDRVSRAAWTSWTKGLCSVLYDYGERNLVMLELAVEMTKCSFDGRELTVVRRVTYKNNSTCSQCIWLLSKYWRFHV